MLAGRLRHGSWAQPESEVSTTSGGRGGRGNERSRRKPHASREFSQIPRPDLHLDTLGGLWELPAPHSSPIPSIDRHSKRPRAWAGSANARLSAQRQASHIDSACCASPASLTRLSHGSKAGKTWFLGGRRERRWTRLGGKSHRATRAARAPETEMGLSGGDCGRPSDRVGSVAIAQREARSAHRRSAERRPSLSR